MDARARFSPRAAVGDRELENSAARDPEDLESLVLDVACARIPRVRWDRAEHAAAAAAAVLISEPPARSAEALPVRP